MSKYILEYTVDLINKGVKFIMEATLREFFDDYQSEEEHTVGFRLYTSANLDSYSLVGFDDIAGVSWKGEITLKGKFPNN